MLRILRLHVRSSQSVLEVVLVEVVVLVARGCNDRSWGGECD